MEGSRYMPNEGNEGERTRAASLLTASEIERGDIARISKSGEAPSLIYLGGEMTWLAHLGEKRGEREEPDSLT